MREEKRIKLCLHCGGEAKIDMLDVGQYLYAVECENCGCRTSSEESEEEAIAIWNKRVPDVVHCGECEYVEKSTYTFPDGDTVTICKCGRINGVMTADDYCSFGKRGAGR